MARRDQAAAERAGDSVKWLLVTTNPAPYMPGTEHPNGDGWNVGDCFARLGTEALVYEVDHDAEISLVNMDDPKTFQNAQPFDRAIFAGRPMFWEGCETHPLWNDLIKGWLCKEPRRVMALGVGTCYRSTRGDKMNVGNYYERTREALAKMWRVVMRHPSPFPQVISSVCPAAWLLSKVRIEPKKRLRLANFMPGGGHYAKQCEFEATMWEAMETRIAGTLIGDKFAAVAHTKREEEHARKLGFTDVHRFDDVFEYLGLYEQAELYFGNRMHGAVVLAGAQEAAAFAVGYDSRIGMVTHAGLRGCAPSELRLDELLWFTGYKPNWREVHRNVKIEAERRRMVELLTEFASNTP
jgi:hypothetical protein